MTVTFTSDAPPVVRGVAATLKRAAAHPKTSKTLQRMKGVLALKSSVDSQAVTARFDRGEVTLEPGAASDAGVVITLDLNATSAKPAVRGAGRHPLLALRAAKVLEPPKGTWREEAAAFWEFASDVARMPRGLLVVCTDEGTEARFGEPVEYEVHGTADALLSMFSGGSIFGQDLLANKLQAVGSFEHASVMTGRSIALVMGGR